MFSKLSLIAVLTACVENVLCADSEFNLYAYSTGSISGLRMFYADGQAYVGGSAPSFASEAFNVTISKSDDDTEFVATPDSTVDETSQPTMYIDTTEGSLNAVGFVQGNQTLGDGSTTTGFGLYGGWAFHTNDESTIEMKFVATPTNETGIYLVKWNAGGTPATDDVPISLRTQAPVDLDS